MKLKSTLSLILAALLLLITMLAGCTNTNTPTGTSTAIQVSDQKDVEDWIKNSSTFRFDGVSGSIQITNIISSMDGNSTISAGEWEFTVKYQTTHPGHGDRTGQVLAQVITDHTAVIKIENGEIISAVCDNVWDLQSDKRLLSEEPSPKNSDNPVNTYPLTPLAIVSEEVTWNIGGTIVAATITRPDDKNIHPAVVFVAGSGPTDRDWNSPLLSGTNGSARLLAEELAKTGYITIRYDKRIAGPNAQNNLPLMMGKISMEGHVEELAGAVNTLIARPDVNPDQIFVLANSEGTIHALNYQQTREPKLAGFILSAMPGRSMTEVLHSQLEAQVASLPNAQEIMDGYDKLMAKCLAGEPFVADPALPEGFNKLVQGFYAPINLPFTTEFLSLNPTSLLKNAAAPVLVITGKKDIQVDPVLDGVPLETVAKGLDNVSFAYPENANHVLKYEPRPREELTGVDAAVTYNAPDRVLDPEALQVIKNWLLQN